MVTRKLLQSRPTILMALLALTSGAFLACGGDAGDQEAAEAEPAVAMTAVATEAAPRVFFTNLTGGEEVVSPVLLEFGIEDYEIVPAQDPIVIEEGKGHHHLGIETECKPAGEIIEKAQPWIHFGDGSSSIDMQLPPGQATLTLQIGDGEHRTLDIEGLCHTITVTVVEGEA